MEEAKKIDLFDAGTVMFFIIALVSDFLFLFGVLGLATGVGLIIVLYVLGAHYLFGLMELSFFWGKTNGKIPKAILVLTWFFPLPLLTIGLIVAIILSTKLGRLLLSQIEKEVAAAAEAAILAAAVVAAPETGGTSLGVIAAEGGAVTAEGAAAVTAEGAGVLAEEGAAAAAETGAEATASGAEDVFKNPLENPMGTTGEELNKIPEDQSSRGEEPEEESEGEDAEKEERERLERIHRNVQRVKKIVRDIGPGDEDEKEQEEEDEDSQEAA